MREWNFAVNKVHQNFTIVWKIKVYGYKRIQTGMSRVTRSASDNVEDFAISSNRRLKIDFEWMWVNDENDLLGGYSTVARVLRKFRRAYVCTALTTRRKMNTAVEFLRVVKREELHIYILHKNIYKYTFMSVDPYNNNTKIHGLWKERNANASNEDAPSNMYIYICIHEYGSLRWWYEIQLYLRLYKLTGIMRMIKREECKQWVHLRVWYVNM